MTTIAINNAIAAITAARAALMADLQPQLVALWGEPIPEGASVEVLVITNHGLANLAAGAVKKTAIRVVDPGLRRALVAANELRLAARDLGR